MNNFSNNEYLFSKTSRKVIGSFLVALCMLCLSVAIMGLSFRNMNSASSAMTIDTYYCVLRINGSTDVVITCTDAQEEPYKTVGYIYVELLPKLVSSGSYYEEISNGYRQYKITKNYGAFKSYYNSMPSGIKLNLTHLYTGQEVTYGAFFYEKTEADALKDNKRVYSPKVVGLNIKTVSDLTWFKNNCTLFYRLNDTVYLENDINLNSATWSPIGSVNNATFGGTFNGNGYTIKNFTIQKTNTDYYSGIGFFGYIEGNAIISNLNLEDVTVKIENTSNYCRGFGIGVLVGHHGFWDDDTYHHNSVVSTLKIWNCALTNCTISIPGGLNAAYSGHYYWSGGMGIGGLVGSSKSSVEIDNCSVRCNITIGGKLGHTYQSNAIWGVGGIMGARLAGLTSYPVGSIDISNCLYSGKISTAGVGAEYGAAGILGVANCLADSSLCSLSAHLENNFVDMSYYSSVGYGSTHPICTGNRVLHHGQAQTREFNYTNEVSNHNVGPECKPFQFIEMKNNYFGYVAQEKPSDIKSVFVLFYDSTTKKFLDYTTSKYYVKYNNNTLSSDSTVAEAPKYQEF